MVIFRCYLDCCSIAEGFMHILCHHVAVFIISHRSQTSLVERHPEAGEQLLSVRMVDFFYAERFLIDKYLHLRRVAAYPHVHHLTFVEVPVRKHMHHGMLFIIRPFCLIHIEDILREACRINQTEIRILCLVRGRLADIVKARPQKLSCRKIPVSVYGNTMLHCLGCPARTAVAKRRTLLVFFR